MRLKDSRTATKAAIEKQIGKGEEEFLSGKVEAAGNFSQALAELKTLFETWNSHNTTLLRAKFEDSTVVDEYNSGIRLAVINPYNRKDDLELYEELKDRARKKIAILTGIIGKLDLYEERPMYGVSGGKLDLLHAQVISVSGKALKDGNLRSAVMDAFVALENHVQNRTGRSDLNGATLMQTVFSKNNPILRLSTDSEEQAGFMMLFTGAVKGIRNQYAHNVVSPADEQNAMEWLGFASALFRLVDHAELIKVSSTV